MLIRGKSPEAVRARIDEYCADAGYQGRERLFLVTQRGYGQALDLLPRRPLGVLRGIGALLLGKAILLKAPLRARSLRVKNNIRVFFETKSSGHGPLTAKIAIQSPHRSGSIRQEVEARQQLAGRLPSGIAAPTISRYDATSFSWLEEEFIDPRSGVEEAEKVSRFLKEAAPSVYGLHLHSQPTVDALTGLGLKPAEVEATLQRLGAKASVLDKRWSIAFVHGDLSPENMIIAKDGKLYIIDWELSALAPVAWDLKKIFHHDQQAVLNTLARLRGSEDLSASAQMLLALGCELLLLRRDVEKRRSYLMSNRGKSEKTALGMIASHQNLLEKNIRMLAGK